MNPEEIESAIKEIDNSCLIRHHFPIEGTASAAKRPND
jgi:hypothetical protein